MLKLALPVLLLAGLGTPAEQPVQGEAAPPSPPPEAAQSPVVDPDADYSCENDPLLVQGAEGDADLFRDPARPDTLEPIRAVDYEVNGCSLLVMTDGSLVRPEDQEGTLVLQPAQ